MTRILISILVAAAFLNGCGSGGGSRSDSGSVNLTPPTAVTPPTTGTPPPIVGPVPLPPATISQTLQLNGGVSTGLSISATANITDYGTPSEVSTLTGVSGPNPAMLTVNPTGPLNSITLQTPNAAVGTSTSSWSYPADAGSVTNTTVEVCGGASCATSQRDLNIATAGVFQYMTFGDWSDVGGSSGTVPAVGGFFVAGQETAPGNIPTSGTATYVGATGGLYLNGGAVSDFVSQFRADANFAARQLAVSTSGMQVGGVLTPQFDYAGTLSYAPGSNQFNGAILTVTPGAGMGTATGKFFGPTAQEIGGVSDMSYGSARAIGVFVGKR